MRSLQKIAPALSVTLLSEPFSRYNITTDLMAPGADELILNRSHPVLMALYTSYITCSDGSLRPLTSRPGRLGERR